MRALTALSVEDVLNEIPEEYRERFEALLEDTLRTPDALRADVIGYLETVRRVGPMVAFIDVDEAEKLGAATLELIGVLRPDQPAVVHQIVQAATRYFVFEDEDEEVTGVLGFDDDIQVVNAVSRSIGRSDLVIPLKRHAL